jgi:hypothetical protein
MKAKKTGVKPHSIEWLRTEFGLHDAFIMLCSSRPLTTTIRPNHDIDYVLTYGFTPSAITTLPTNIPAKSDHLGILVDINIQVVFGGQYTPMISMIRRKLSSRNIKAKESYIRYIAKQFLEHRLLDKTSSLLETAHTGNFKEFHNQLLQELDKHITEILLSGEDGCSTGDIGHNPWSPKLQQAGRRLSYWKKKMSMAQKNALDGIK